LVCVGFKQGVKVCPYYRILNMAITGFQGNI